MGDTTAVNRKLIRRRNAERALLGSMSRRALARKARLDISHVSRALRGERGLSPEAVSAIATALGLTMDEFYAKLRAMTGGKVKRREWRH